MGSMVGRGRIYSRYSMAKYPTAKPFERWHVVIGRLVADLFALPCRDYGKTATTWDGALYWTCPKVFVEAIIETCT